MDALDRLAILAELTEDFCELHHGANTKKEDYKAIDVVVKEFQNKQGEIKSLYIPICQDCMTKMHDNNYILLYCFECDATRWLPRGIAKNKYSEEHNTIWLRGCPDCTGKFGGIYFDK